MLNSTTLVLSRMKTLLCSVSKVVLTKNTMKVVTEEKEVAEVAVVVVALTEVAEVAVEVSNPDQQEVDMRTKEVKDAKVEEVENLTSPKKLSPLCEHI